MKKNLNNVLLPALAALLLLSCSSEVESPVTPEYSSKALSFAPIAGDGAPTRAYITNNTRAGGTKLQTVYPHFMVRTMKHTDATHLVMPDYSVQYADGVWFYQGKPRYQAGSYTYEGNDQYLKFWDLSATQYTFAAVTPDPHSANYMGYDATVTISNEGNINISNIQGNVPDTDLNMTDPSPEWMIARTIRTQATLTDRDDIAGTEASASAFTAGVPLHFHHIMAKVDFLAYTSSGVLNLDKFKVELKDDEPAAYQIPTKADFATPASWTEPAGGYAPTKTFCDYTYLDGRVVGSDPDEPVLLVSHVEIPQSWVYPGRTMKVTGITKDGVTFAGDIVLDNTTNGGYSWDGGKHYRYILKINNSGTNEIILFAVDMEVWKWKPGSEKEEEENNW